MSCSKIRTNESLTKRRWLIMAVSCMINICIGSVYAWSSLAAPMAAELKKPDLAIVFSILNAFGFISMILGGNLNDRYGPRWLIFFGGLIQGAGMILSGSAQGVPGLIVSYGLMVGLGSSLVYGCTIGGMIKWFPDKRGLAGGMATASYGISSVIFAPLAENLSNAVGVRNTFRIFGIVFILVICAGFSFIEKCPENFVPVGYQPSKTNVSGKKKSFTPKEMLQTPAFYIMLLMMFCGASFGTMIISNARGIAVTIAGVSGVIASGLVSVLCLCNTAGRLVAGTLSDRIGRIHTVTIAMLIAVCGLSALLLASGNGSLALLVAGVILTGICFGTFMGVFPGFCTDRFGSEHNTVNYGIMWIGFSFGGVVGPMILSKTYEKTGQYAGAFVTAILLCAAGIILSQIYRRIVKKEERVR